MQAPTRQRRKPVPSLQKADDANDCNGIETNCNDCNGYDETKSSPDFSTDPLDIDSEPSFSNSEPSISNSEPRISSAQPSTPPSSRGFERVAAIEIRRMALDELQPHPRNDLIRKHPEPGSSKWEVLKESLKHDYFDPIVFNLRNGCTVSGHLRTKVMREIGFTHADVLVVSYDEPTHLARMMAANKSIGEDDIEGQKQALIELRDLEGFEFALTGFDLPEVDLLDGDSGSDGDGGDNPYTRNVSPPVYEIKGECPALGDLTDVSKTVELFTKIDESSVPDDIKTFLRAAAARHTVFDYEKIAEYYAHAAPEVQELFEDSALVIIDFEKALELGYVAVNDGVKEQFLQDYEGNDGDEGDEDLPI